MVLKAVVGFTGGCHQLCLKDLKINGSTSSSHVSRKLEVSNFARLECRGIYMIDDENAASFSSLDVKKEKGNGCGERIVWHRDLSSLPKPLSATDFSESKNGANMRIAFQGSPGAFSESAALKAYPDCQTIPCEQFEVAFKAVELRAADKAVLPVENTFSGSIHRNYDLLLRHRLHIVNEVQLTINYCLMALPGVSKDEIKRVLSHPLALDQCETVLNELGLVRENTVDTAAAAQTVSSSGFRDAGAIASYRAALLYGLNVIEERIQDSKESITRFLILARQPIIPQIDRPYKTSIVFTLEEGPEFLFKAMSVFTMRGINLSKIESRPRRKRPLRIADGTGNGTATYKYFDYLFYFDFEASMAEPRAQNAMGHLQEVASFLRVLGSYPIDVFL